MSSVEMLQAARDRLVRDGWTKRTLADWEGKHCAVGAVMDVTLLSEKDEYVKFDRDIHALTAEEYVAISFLASLVPPVLDPYGAYNPHPPLDYQRDVLKVTTFNDSSVSFNRVLAWFDDAILAAKEAEA